MRRSISRRLFIASTAMTPLTPVTITSAAGGAKSDWLHTRTPAFSLYGRVSEKTLVQMAQDLQDFDGLLRILHGVDAQPNGKPLPIYLVPRRFDLQRVKPGLASGVGGFYTSSIGEIFAVMSVEGGEDQGRRVLFHEYTHHFMKQHAPAAYPAWLVEGYAEYFMTARFKPDVVELGVTSPRIAWLRGTSWTPFKEILGRRALTGGRADIVSFYAQSWILTHYMMSDPERLKRFARYARGVADGGDPVGLMPEAAGVPLEDLPRVLRDHMAALPGRRMARPPSTAGALEVTRLPASADDLILENQRLKMGVPKPEREKALAMIRERAARYPGDRLAEMTLARAENDYGDRAKAQALLKQRIATDPRDVEAIQTLGYSYMLQARVDRAQAPKLLNEARDWFGKGFAVDRDNALLLYDYAISRRGEPGYPNDNAVNVLLRAQELAPQVPQFRIAAADALMRRDRFEEAAAMLEPVFNDPHVGPEAAEAQRRFEEAIARRRPVETVEDGDKSG
jgi:hypothetical protein